MDIVITGFEGDSNKKAIELRDTLGMLTSEAEKTIYLIEKQGCIGLGRIDEEEAETLRTLGFKFSKELT